MRWAALVFFFGWLSACVRFDEPRAYRCSADAQCDFGWRCLQDGYCHDPAVGARVSCASGADCTGEWVCGQDRFCRAPQDVGPFPCDDDSQCGRGWRCTTEHRCYDLTLDPAPPPFKGAAGPAVLRSPLLDAGAVVHTSPGAFVFEDGGVGSATLRFAAANVRGASLEFVGLRAQLSTHDVDTWRGDVSLGAPPRDVAVGIDRVLVLGGDGGLQLHFPTTPVPTLDVTPGFAPERIAPLVWTTQSDVFSFFAVFSGARTSLVTNAGGTVDYPGDVVDLTPFGFDDAGVPQLLVLRGFDGIGWPLNVEPLVGGKSTTLATIVADEGSTNPQRVRAEAEGIVVLAEGPGIIANPVVRAVQLGSTGPLLSAAVSCQGPAPSDFGVGGAVGQARQPVAVCQANDQQVLFSLDAQGTAEASLVREGRQAVGVSGGHLRQLQEGQLAWSFDFLPEWFDVLPQRPDAVTVRSGVLVALAERSLFVATPDSVGLVPFSRITQGPSVASFVDGADWTVVDQGFVLGVDPQGAQRFVFAIDVPDGTEVQPGAISRLLDTAQGRLLVVSSGDALYAGLEVEGSVGFAAARLRPAPGFPIDGWILREAEGGLVEGWAVANNRLFQLSATSETRWKSSEVSVQGRDPLAVWFSGGATLLGTTHGEVLSLPGRLPLVPRSDELEFTGMVGVCGAVFASTEEAVFVLREAQWEQVPMRAVVLPELVVASSRLFVTDENGVVQEIPVACP